MSYTKSKHFLKSKLNEESALSSAKSDFEKDDDDPLSMRSLSLASIGIIIAFLTILLPSISILIVRPLSQEGEVILNHTFKTDGS